MLCMLIKNSRSSWKVQHFVEAKSKSMTFQEMFNYSGFYVLETCAFPGKHLHSWHLAAALIWRDSQQAAF